MSPTADKNPFQGAPRPASAAVQAIARVRNAVVGVESAVGVGSGYCALSNGIIVTSQRVVGYERDVLLTLDDGTVLSAVVVRVNVALDVALLIPTERVPIPPLRLSARSPELGEACVVLGRVGVDAVAIPTTVTAVERNFDNLPHIQIAAAIESGLGGAPLLDLDGNLFGSLVRPRRGADGVWAKNLVLSSSAFEGGLLSVEGPADEVKQLLPEYGCPRCDTVFEPRADRCLECGASLPHPWLTEPITPPRSKMPERAIHAVKVALASLGVAANRARVGAALWRFSPGPEQRDLQIDITLDETGDFILVRAPIARIPDGLFEPFYRHLLVLNDSATEAHRFGIRDSVVSFSMSEPVASVTTQSFPQQVSSFLKAYSRHQELLTKLFSAEPLFDETRL